MNNNILGQNKIFAVYDDNTIRVYQAYNNKIADEALRKGTFGSNFSLDRMSWIKPSFLWMMYRSGWGCKEGQNRILAIDMKREGFDSIVNKAVLTTYNSNLYASHEAWKTCLKNSDVRCQWDPSRDMFGNPLQEKTIQLGLKGECLWKYVNEWIVNISDITDFTKSLLTKRKSDLEDITQYLPIEKEYPYL